MVREREPCTIPVRGKESVKGFIFLGTTVAQPEETQSHRKCHAHTRVFDPECGGSGTQGSARSMCAGLSPGTGVGLGCSSKILLTKSRTDPLPTVPQPPGPCASHHLTPLLPWAAFLPLPFDGAGDAIQGQAAHQHGLH